MMALMNTMPIALALVPLYLAGVAVLAKWILRRLPDGKVKRLLLRRIGPEEPAGNRQDPGRLLK